MPTPERTILVHGDKEAMEHFAGLLPKTTSVEMPELGESHNL
jgi:predicted metal-dependent RNase